MAGKVPGSTEGYIHQSVLKAEVLALLKPAKAVSIYVDANLGEGGHTEALLSAYTDVRVFGVERDAEIAHIAAQRLERFGDRVKIINSWFTDFFREYDSLCTGRPDRILFDLGISMYHYKKSGLGFSFQEEEPLDMRLDRETGISAGDMVNNFAESELVRIFREFGEERFAGRIAGRIAEERKKGKIKTTRQLADLIKAVIPARVRYKEKIHPATRCFQALRIAVNHELENLKEVLTLAFSVLNPGGRMGIIAYHSLEDREVKHFFQEKNRVCTCPPEWPVCKCGGKKQLELITRKPVYPTEEEITGNHAARSARFRVGEKLPID